jgi:hypothetical protein
MVGLQRTAWRIVAAHAGSDSEEVSGVMGDLLFDPLVRKCLCGKKPFQFAPDRLNVAVLNRAEIGDKAALTIGLFLMAQFDGQLVVPDLGFYGHDVALVRQKRLIAGVNFLSELPPMLRNAVRLGVRFRTGYRDFA